MPTPTPVTLLFNNVILRTGPGRNFHELGQAHQGTHAESLDTHTDDQDAHDDQGTLFVWHFLVLSDGRMGWVRADLLRTETPVSVGASGSMTIPAAPLNPAPPTIPVRPPSLSLYPRPVLYDRMNEFEGQHIGWDFLGEIGRPVLSGPLGGTVIASSYCQKCGPASISAVSNGRKLNDPAILSDSTWNFGYGHYLIVRYDNHLLPAQTHQFLSSKGWAGYHAFVMYAHLKQMLVTEGDVFTEIKPIATLGNSGNSTGPHLHLELRFGQKALSTWWARLKPGLADPGVLFAR